MILPTLVDNIWVNQWNHKGNSVFTVYSTIPTGYKNVLIYVQPDTMFHFVDVYHHNEIMPKYFKGSWKIDVETNSFDQKWVGTNNEGAVDCIFKAKKILYIQRRAHLIDIDFLQLNALNNLSYNIRCNNSYNEYNANGYNNYQINQDSYNQ